MNADRSLMARSLERRLLISYVGAFAVVITIFAIAVRFSFAALFNAQTTARLNTLARAGTAAVLFTGTKYRVDEHSLGGFSVRTAFEGLEWFDRQGKIVVVSRGLTPAPVSPPHDGFERLESGTGTALDTFTLALVDRRNVAYGYVRASEAYDSLREPIRALDRGLIAGALLALLAGAFGGALLARASVARAEASYERLRQFTSDASHELRGPIAALSSTAEVALREEPDLPEITRKRLHDLLDLSGLMRRLVDDLLILARAGNSMERELFAIDVGSLLRNVHDRYGAGAAAKGIMLQVTGGADVTLYGNPDQVERILANLLENAIRYTADGGTIRIACTIEPSTVRISVEDSGRGIARENLTRVFDRFWREDTVRSRDGAAGLGLAIARALARRHGGDVVAESELGRGSTFTLVLPRRPPGLG